MARKSKKAAAVVWTPPPVPGSATLARAAAFVAGAVRRLDPATPETPEPEAAGAGPIADEVATHPTPADAGRSRVAVRLDCFLGAALARSFEETRYYLGGVQIEPGPGGTGAILVATDGHILAAIFDPAGVVEGPPQIWAADPKLLIKLTPRLPAYLRSKDPFVIVELTGASQSPGTIAVGWYQADTTHDLSLQVPVHPDLVVRAETPSLVIDGSFPEWRRVVPRGADYEGKSAADKHSIDSRLLRRLCDITQQTFGTRAGRPLSLQYMTEGAPGAAVLGLTAPDRESGVRLVLVVMPMRDAGLEPASKAMDFIAPKARPKKAKKTVEEDSSAGELGEEPEVAPPEIAGAVDAEETPPALEQPPMAA